MVFTDPWRLTIQHFIKNNPDTPDIIFSIVSSFLQTLWTHVERSTYQFTNYFLVLVLDRMHESKVSYFILIVVDEDIGRLDISVDETTCQYLTVTLTDILDYFDSFSWFHFLI